MVYDTVTAGQIDTFSPYEYQSLLDFNPVYNKLYSITTKSDPRDIIGYEITDGDIRKCYDSPYYGDYYMTTYIKVSPDGQYIFNGSGNVFGCAPKRTGDMIYAGNVGKTFGSICFDVNGNEFYIAYNDRMYIYDYNTWLVKGVVPGATGYLLYRSASEYGPYSLLKTTAALSYTNAGLKTGTTYYYKVRAYKGSVAAAGEFSTAVSATPALDEMSGVKAATYYPTAIRVSWNSVPGRTGYKVYRSDTQEGEYKYIGYTTYTYYKDKGLAVDKTYYYKVRAYRTVSDKKIYNEYSPAVNDTTRVFQATGLKTSMYSVTSNKITWSSVTGASGYEVSRSEAEDGEYLLVKTTGYTYYYDKTIVAGKTYYYKVRAYRTTSDGKKYGDYSTVATCVSKVAGIKAVMYTVNSNKISWSSVPSRTAYEVYWAESQDGPFTKIPTTLPLTSAYIYHKNLEPEKIYYYKVLAYQMVNSERKDSGYSNTVSIENKVTGAKAVCYSYKSNKITWNSVASRTGYEVWRSLTPNEGDFVKIVPKSTTPYTSTYYIDTGLTTDSTYYYRICAYQMINGSKTYCNFSDVVSATPHLSSVTGAKASRYSSSKIKLSWYSVSGATGYEIWSSTTGNDGDFIRIKTTASTYYYNGGLTSGTVYYYRIRALRTVGEATYYGNWSKTVSAKP